MGKTLGFLPHHFLDTAYPGMAGKPLTLAALEALCAAARAGGASSSAPVTHRLVGEANDLRLRITWSD